jgi:hypothetical protein
MSEITTLSDELWSDIEHGRVDRSKFLFLEESDSLKRQWKVESFDENYWARMGDTVTRFSTVSVSSYPRFARVADEMGYTPVFMDDPTDHFDWVTSLDRDPLVAVNSSLEGTIGGFLPFQARGLNFMKSTNRCVYFQWSTGTGKTLAAEGTILVKSKEGYGENKDEGFDLCLYVVKPNNLVNTQRKLKDHTGLTGRILSGTPKRRQTMIAETAAAMVAGEQPILIFNAEKFREDTELLKLLVEDHKLLVIFDEMPTKYANRGTALYKATAEVLYTTFVIPQDGKGKGKPLFYPSVKGDRPSEVFYVAMSATPISNSPEDFFNSIRLMDSSIYGSVKDFNNQFVSSRDRWFQIDGWKSLDLMGAMAAHIVHQVDKHTDPEINAQFPTKLPPETVYCDMDSATEKLYAKLQKEYENIKNGSMLDFEEILAAIGTFQMLCSNPRSVLISAKIREEYEAKLDDFLATDPSEDEIKEFEKKFRDGSLVALKLRTLVNDDSKFTDENAKGECIVSKMIELRERIEQNDDKVIVFSTMNQTLLPLISEWLDKWGITHVSYHGGITGHANKQAIIDEFRTNPDVKVFLSTDAGSDSIDLPEATLTIHYDLPWTKSKITQRENRQDRIDSTKDAVQVVTLAVPFTVEDRKAEILSIKQGYHDSLFNGVISETEGKAVKSDFFYILTGKREGE